MKGTQLANMSTSYEDVQKNINGVEATVRRMVEEIPEKEARRDDLQKKLDATQKIADQKAKLQRLKGEQGWALVIEKEQVCVGSRSGLISVPRRLSGRGR